MVALHRSRRSGRRGAVLLVAASAVLWGSTASASAALKPAGLKTNGLLAAAGIGDTTPDFSWKLAGDGPRGDAVGVRDPRRGHRRRSWPPGRTCGSRARSPRPSSRTSSTAGSRSRRASRRPGRYACGTRPARRPPWSAPATFETGLLKQSDWGSAKWIELAGRTNAQPLPIFARAVLARRAKPVKSARLYMSGLGLFEAQLNGAKLTDEVLAPGYTNYQLSAEYRTYDVTGKLRGGANTLGVELGNGTANNIKMANPAVGRTNSFALVEQHRGRQRRR